MRYIIALLKRLLSFVHCISVKILHPNSFFFDGQEIIANSTHFTILDNGKIHIGKKCGMRRNCEVSSVENGEIIIGNNSFMNKGCIIASHEKIIIGNNTRFGPNVCIFDHDYDFKNPDENKRKMHKTSPIIIGNNVWIGAGCIVLRGTTIGDNCVIGAGSIIKGEIKSNTVVYQKRENIMINMGA